MSVVERSRVLRPSTRQDSSESYKVDTAAVGHTDILRLSLYHEGDSERAFAILEFDGKDIADLASIHFKAREVDGLWRCEFSPVRPSAVLHAVANAASI